MQLAELIVRLTEVQVELDVLAAAVAEPWRLRAVEALEQASLAVTAAADELSGEANRAQLARQPRRKENRAEEFQRVPTAGATPAPSRAASSRRPPNRYYVVVSARRGVEGQPDGAVGLYNTLAGFAQQLRDLDRPWVGRGHFEWCKHVEGLGFPTLDDARGYWLEQCGDAPLPRHF